MYQKRKTTNKNNIFSILKRLIYILIICFLIFSIYRIKLSNDSFGEKHIKKDIEIESLNNSINSENTRNKELENKDKTLNSNENIEELARDLFGYIKPDETIIKPKNNE